VNPGNLAVLDVCWLRLPCQPAATVTLEVHGNRFSLTVEPSPPPPPTCPAEGVIAAIRLFLRHPVPADRVNARLVKTSPDAAGRPQVVGAITMIAPVHP
jgi:hypothetical protein